MDGQASTERACADPRYAAAMALTVEYLMHKYGLDRVDFNVNDVPADGVASITGDPTTGQITIVKIRGENNGG
jgi:hypothetical protein